MRAAVKRVFAVAVMLMATACGQNVANYGANDCGKGYFAGEGNACIHWPENSTIPYTFDSGVTANFSAAQQTEIHHAFERWAGMTQGVHFQFDPSARPTNDGDSDGVSTIHVVKTGWTREHSTQAYTQVVSSGDTIVLAQIYFNAQDFDLSVDVQPGKLNLGSLAQHEIGHFLGLTHDKEHSMSVMFPSLPLNYERQEFYSKDLERLGLFYSLTATAQSLAHH